ncbi:MAG TPA: hypothetical protein VFJ67_03055, partial [Thermodesulfobacteriota bacterium]|nr:hypothetical protein [Thermodesulfobacteriota bacterium]
TLKPDSPNANSTSGSPIFPVFAKSAGGRYTFTGSLNALIITKHITNATPMIMQTDKKTLPARNISIVFFESDDIMSAGVARYITKSLIGERSIFFHLPKK